MAPADAGRRRYYAEVTTPLGPAQANKLRVHGRNLQESWQHRPVGRAGGVALLLSSSAVLRGPETGNLEPETTDAPDGAVEPCICILGTQRTCRVLKQKVQRPLQLCNDDRVTSMYSVDLASPRVLTRMCIIMPAYMGGEFHQDIGTHLLIKIATKNVALVLFPGWLEGLHNPSFCSPQYMSY